MRPYYEKAGVTIYHGDCRAVLPLLTERPRLVLADPPYGVGIGDKSGGTRTRLAVAGDDYYVVGDDEPFDPAHLLALQTPTILWGANHFADKLPPSPSWFVWDKRDGTTSDDNADCELAWTNLGGPARMYTHLWRGMIKASERDQRRLHPTQKPVALMRWCLQRAGLKPGNLVLDPYMGSGPVLRAAMDLGLRCIGIELEERYCDIAARRLSQEVMQFEAAP